MPVLPAKFGVEEMAMLQERLQIILESLLVIPKASIEAFANVYNSAAVAISDEVSGKYPRKSGYDFPDIRDGIIGMAFIETVVKSSKSKDKWVKFPSIPK